MGVTLRSIIIAALLMICAAILYHYSSFTGQISNEELTQRFPNFEASGFTGEIYNQKGQLDYSMYTEKITYYKRRDTLYVTNLTGIFYDHSDPEFPERGWQLTAGRGELELGRQARLEDQIRVVPNYAESEIREISTPSVYFDLKSNIISSAETITLRGDKFINTGSNYEIDLTRKTFVIKDNPHVVYQP